MRDELKPCPFCGGEAELCTKVDDGIAEYWVRCKDGGCAYSLHLPSPNVVIGRGNRRI